MIPKPILLWTYLMVGICSSIPGRIVEDGPLGKCGCEDRMAALEVNICSLGAKYGGALSNSAFTSSSTWGRGHEAYRGRLNTKAGSGVWGGWCPATREYNSAWFQIDLGQVQTVAAIVTQGREDYGEWIRTFKLAVGLAQNNLTFILEASGGPMSRIYNGNSDQNTYVISEISPPVKARYVRLYPLWYYRKPILRMEVLNC